MKKRLTWLCTSSIIGDTKDHKKRAGVSEAFLKNLFYLFFSCCFMVMQSMVMSAAPGSPSGTALTSQEINATLRAGYFALIRGGLKKNGKVADRETITTAINLLSSKGNETDQQNIETVRGAKMRFLDALQAALTGAPVDQEFAGAMLLFNVATGDNEIDDKFKSITKKVNESIAQQVQAIAPEQPKKLLPTASIKQPQKTGNRKKIIQEAQGVAEAMTNMTRALAIVKKPDTSAESSEEKDKKDASGDAPEALSKEEINEIIKSLEASSDSSSGGSTDNAGTDALYVLAKGIKNATDELQKKITEKKMVALPGIDTAQALLKKAERQVAVIAAPEKAQRATVEVLTSSLPAPSLTPGISGVAPSGSAVSSGFALRDFLVRCYEHHPDQKGRSASDTNNTRIKMEQLLGLVDAYKTSLTSSDSKNKEFSALVYSTAIAHFSDTLEIFIAKVASCFVPQVTSEASVTGPEKPEGVNDNNKARIIATLNELVPEVIISTQPVVSDVGDVDATSSDTGDAGDKSSGAAGDKSSDVTGGSDKGAEAAAWQSQAIVAEELSGNNAVRGLVLENIEKLKQKISEDSSDEGEILKLCMTIDIALPTMFFSLDDITVALKEVVTQIAKAGSTITRGGTTSLHEFITRLADTIKTVSESTLTTLSTTAQTMVPYIKKFVSLLIPLLLIAVYWYLTSNLVSKALLQGFSLIMPSVLSAASDAARESNQLFVSLYEAAGLSAPAGSELFRTYGMAKAFSFDQVLGLDRAGFLKVFQEYATLYKVLGSIMGLGIGYCLDKVLDPFFDYLFGKPSTEPTSWLSWGTAHNIINKGVRYSTRTAVMYGLSSFSNSIFDPHVGVDELFLNNFDSSQFMATAGTGKEGTAEVLWKAVYSVHGAFRGVTPGLSPEFNPFGAFTYKLFTLS